MEHLITEIREWIAFIVECLILLVIWMEYTYDKAKDDKRKRTKTTKKTTTTKSGESVTEESVEVSEPTNDLPNNK